jgi:hypothetical protein
MMLNLTVNKIQFRTGRRFGERICDRAAEWNVTPNEASKRLALLADYGLTTQDHDRVAALADALGGFMEAARYISWKDSNG